MKKTYILNTKDYLLEPYHSDSIAGDTLLATPKMATVQSCLSSMKTQALLATSLSVPAYRRFCTSLILRRISYGFPSRI